MSIFAAFTLVGMGIALSETYAIIRRRAERAAYESGYKQANRENEIRVDAIDEYAVTTPRRLTEYQADDLQRWPATTALRSFDGTIAKPAAQVGQSFMDRMHANGQATVWMGKEESK